MKKVNILIAVITVMAVITFVAIVMPSLAHNIMNDLIARR